MYISNSIYNRIVINDSKGQLGFVGLNIKEKALGILIAVLLFSSRHATGQTVDYSVHANIIYHLTRYIDWPENKKTGDFVIGVIGDSPIVDELRNVTLGKQINNQKIIIKVYSYNQASYNCQVLFISEEERNSLKRITTLFSAEPVLLITEEEGLAYKGSCINFIIVDGKLKMEININNIEARNLKVANELLSLGKIIK
jgi:hypothetical protein